MTHLNFIPYVLGFSVPVGQSGRVVSTQLFECHTNKIVKRGKKCKKKKPPQIAPQTMSCVKFWEGGYKMGLSI